MGQESRGIDDVRQRQGSEPPSKGGDPTQTVGELAARAEAIRGNLDELVDEVQRRGKRVMKPVAVGVTGLALVALVLGGAVVWRRRRLRPPPSRLRGLASALRRMAEHPDRVAEEQRSISKKVIASAGAALASIVVHQLAQAARAKISRTSDPDPGA